MNLLTEKLPDSISVCGENFAVNTDFRVWIKVENIFAEKRQLTPDMLLQLFSLVLAEKVLPKSFGDTLSAILTFYACNKTSSKKASGSNASNVRVVSFTEDAGLIYAAFLAQYGIDLTATSLHWWKFRALFDGLTDKHKICEIMGYRAMDLSKIKNREQRAHYRKLKEMYKLPDTRSIEEIERDNIRNLEKFF